MNSAPQNPADLQRRIERLRTEIAATERRKHGIDHALKTRRETLRRWEAQYVLERGVHGPANLTDAT